MDLTNLFDLFSSISAEQLFDGHIIYNLFFTFPLILAYGYVLKYLLPIVDNDAISNIITYTTIIIFGCFGYFIIGETLFKSILDYGIITGSLVSSVVINGWDNAWGMRNLYRKFVNREKKNIF